MLRSFAGGRMFGTAHGAAVSGGPVRVVALPGWGRTAADFDPVLAGLDAVALEPPGFGRSPEPARASGAAGYAADVAAVLREMGAAAAPLVVVGHSFGGRVAVHLGASHPELVTGLVLTGVPNLVRRDAPAARPALGYRVTRWLHRRGVVGDQRMERLRRKHGSSDYRAASGVMRDVLVTVVNEDYEREIATLRCPVELVWGSRDSAAPVEMARAAAARMPTASLTVLEGVDHFTPQAAPSDLRAAIDRLLGAA